MDDLRKYKEEDYYGICGLCSCILTDKNSKLCKECGVCDRCVKECRQNNYYNNLTEAQVNFIKESRDSSVKLLAREFRVSEESIYIYRRDLKKEQEQKK